MTTKHVFAPGDVVTSGTNKNQVGVVVAVEVDSTGQTICRVLWNTGGEETRRDYWLTPIEKHIELAHRKLIEMQIRADRARERYAALSR